MCAGYRLIIEPPPPPPPLTHTPGLRRLVHDNLAPAQPQPLFPRLDIDDPKPIKFFLAAAAVWVALQNPMSISKAMPSLSTPVPLTKKVKLTSMDYTPAPLHHNLSWLLLQW